MSEGITTPADLLTFSEETLRSKLLLDGPLHFIQMKDTFLLRSDVSGAESSIHAHQSLRSMQPSPRQSRSRSHRRTSSGRHDRAFYTESSSHHSKHSDCDYNGVKFLTPRGQTTEEKKERGGREHGDCDCNEVKVPTVQPQNIFQRQLYLQRLQHKATTRPPLIAPQILQHPDKTFPTVIAPPSLQSRMDHRSVPIATAPITPPPQYQLKDRKLSKTDKTINLPDIPLPVQGDSIPQLWSACARNDVETVKTMLTEGEDMEEVVSGWTPLMKAAEEGAFECVQLLLDKKANIEATTHKGRTALSFAAAPSMRNPDMAHRPISTDVIYLMLERGANAAHKDQQGKTAQDRAEISKRYDAVTAFDNFKYERLFVGR